MAYVNVINVEVIIYSQGLTSFVTILPSVLILFLTYAATTTFTVQIPLFIHQKERTIAVYFLTDMARCFIYIYILYIYMTDVIFTNLSLSKQGIMVEKHGMVYSHCYIQWWHASQNYFIGHKIEPSNRWKSLVPIMCPRAMIYDPNEDWGANGKSYSLSWINVMTCSFILSYTCFLSPTQKVKLMKHQFVRNGDIIVNGKHAMCTTRNFIPQLFIVI